MYSKSSSSLSSSSSSVVPQRKRRNDDDRRHHRKCSKSRNRFLPGSRSPASSHESPCRYHNERHPHSRRQAEEFNQHHHSNRHFQTSATPQSLDQQQSYSLSPVPNSKCFCVIHVCLFFNTFHIFSFAHIFNACLFYLQSVNFIHYPGPRPRSHSTFQGSTHLRSHHNQ